MYTIVNDLHLGVQRQAGATPVTSRALQAKLENDFGEFLQKVKGRLVILGDLFDKYQVDTRSFVATFSILHQWLQADDSNELILVRGNHDVSKNSTNMSSIDALASVLMHQDYKKIILIGQPFDLEPGLRVIPHLANQSLFDLALERAVKDGIEEIWIHANYDNPFAAEKDHSLNLSKKQAAQFKTVVCAHEHVKRTVDNVIILGNQWPSSISDCLGVTEKFAHSTSWTEEFNTIPTWSAEDSYMEVDWRELDGQEAEYIRVTGAATAEEATTVINAINRLRQQSNAFLITNATVIDGVDMEEIEEMARQSLAAVDVMELFYGFLGDAKSRRVRDLRQKHAN